MSRVILVPIDGRPSADRGFGATWVLAEVRNSTSWRVRLEG